MKFLICLISLSIFMAPSFSEEANKCLYMYERSELIVNEREGEYYWTVTLSIKVESYTPCKDEDISEFVSTNEEFYSYIIANNKLIAKDYDRLKLNINKIREEEKLQAD